MQTCPKCAQAIPDNAAICRGCGHVLPPAPTADLLASQAPGTPPPAAPASSSSSKPANNSRGWTAMMVVLACGMALLLLTVWTGRSTPASATATAAAALPLDPQTARTDAPSNAPVTHAVTTDTKDAPRWVVSRPSHFARYGRDVVIAEVAASEEVAVWHKRVRPQLTVRCAGGTTEIYVMTHAAASFETNTKQHTVQLAFDDGEPAVQMWDHSVNHDALFALDSGPVLSPLLAANHLSFTFTPFNSPAATAHFNVAGLKEHLQKSARTCGWKR